MISATIVTIYDPTPNYGNRLQNYAVQFVLERIDVSSKTVSFQKCELEWRKELKYFAQKMTGYRLPGNKNYWRNEPARILTFNRFNKKFIHTERITAIDQISKTDFYILGSDQVWNPTWYTDSVLKKDLFLLTFAKPEQKVCFSPSFSVDSLDDEWIPWFKEHLGTIPKLSVRENAGARIIKELTGRDAVVTIDPTMMLNQREWMSIAKQPKNVDCSGTYILTYFLGGESLQAEHDINRYKDEIGVDNVYNLLDYNQPDIFVSGPSEFIYLIDHAQLILTDSFHACVFSFLFGKPFLCYDRIGVENSMNSRMETLFTKFDLQRKYVNSGLPNELMECDYSKGYITLEKEREKMIHFLKESMSLK